MSSFLWAADPRHRQDMRPRDDHGGRREEAHGSRRNRRLSGPLKHAASLADPSKAQGRGQAKGAQKRAAAGAAGCMRLS